MVLGVPDPEVERILDFSPGPSRALLVSNLDWTQDLPALDFLRDIGKHFPVSQMLARESVRARLEGSGITFTEFSYQLLQAMDYLELYRRHGCTLQVGGSMRNNRDGAAWDRSYMLRCNIFALRCSNQLLYDALGLIAGTTE